MYTKYQAHARCKGTATTSAPMPDAPCREPHAANSVPRAGGTGAGRVWIQAAAKPGMTVRRRSTSRDERVFQVVVHRLLWHTE
jgi:hypothetical protein